MTRTRGDTAHERHNFWGHVPAQGPGALDGLTPKLPGSRRQKGHMDAPAFSPQRTPSWAERGEAIRAQPRDLARGASVTCPDKGLVDAGTG